MMQVFLGFIAACGVGVGYVVVAIIGLPLLPIGLIAALFGMTGLLEIFDRTLS